MNPPFTLQILHISVSLFTTFLNSHLLNATHSWHTTLGSSSATQCKWIHFTGDPCCIFLPIISVTRLKAPPLL
uniref:Uncharacterized protein n=1 Tax=Babesia bovis TaxID=5865 RepID=S6BA65_BABBO|nr:hypothetical protein [Babesia bovis]